MREDDDTKDEQEVDSARSDLAEIVFDAVYSAIRDAIEESDLESAIIEGMRIVADELLEQFMSQKTWLRNKREN